MRQAALTANAQHYEACENQTRFPATSGIPRAKRNATTSAPTSMAGRITKSRALICNSSSNCALYVVPQWVHTGETPVTLDIRRMPHSRSQAMPTHAQA